MKKLLQRTSFLIPALFLAAVMTGCETTEGAGRDIQDAGEAIEDTSRDVQN